MKIIETPVFKGSEHVLDAWAEMEVSTVILRKDGRSLKNWLTAIFSKRLFYRWQVCFYYQGVDDSISTHHVGYCFKTMSIRSAHIKCYDPFEEMVNELSGR